MCNGFFTFPGDRQDKDGENINIFEAITRRNLLKSTDFLVFGGSFTGSFGSEKFYPIPANMLVLKTTMTHPKLLM